jgi:glycosyltransferase involved in cell wall biosynthesis
MAPTIPEPAESQRKVIVVMPAYNAARTLKKTVDDLPRDKIADVILVDDGSRDDTIQIAKTLGLTVFTHTRNFGYGANQKTCYTEALNAGAAIVVMVHPDYQYDPTFLPQLIRPVEDDTADVVFGSRMMGVSAFRQGMPWWKYIANKFLTSLENRIFRLRLSEFHTGYRAYSRKVLEQVNFRANSDGFIFDQDIVAQIVECGLRITEVPVPVRYFPEASSTNLATSIVYGLGILWLLFRYRLHRAGLWRSPQFVAYPSRYRPA